MKPEFQTPIGASQILFGYVRGSTEEQKNTIDAQINELRAYARREGLDMPDWAIFVDSGTSAKKRMFFERPEIQNMLDTMREQGAVQFAVTKLDRAFRNVMDCLSALKTLKQHGIRFHLTSMKIDMGTVHGEFFMTLLAAVAQMENGIRADRQSSSYMSMRRTGQRCGAVPYGWDAVPSSSGRRSKTGRDADDLEPNETEQAVLKLMQGLRRDEGMSYAAIANHLNLNTIPSKHAGEVKGGKVCSGAWHASTVKKALDHAGLMSQL